MTPTNAELRQFIFDAFSDEELDTLCFDYFREVHQNFTAGLIKTRKILLLISYCDTRDLMGDLYAALERERPAKWRQRFGVPPVEKPGFSEETRFLERGRDPRQIFLSHATADAIFARRLAGDLRAEGWRVWIAPDSIRPGEKWVEAIERGLEESGVFVVALTPAAVASRWVRSETNAAVALEHRALMRLLPLDVVECAVPLLWDGYQRTSFRRSYEMGLKTLLEWLELDSVTHYDLPIISTAPAVADTQKSPNNLSTNKTELPQQSKETLCPNCGSVNPITYKFCSYCGVGILFTNVPDPPKVLGYKLRGSDGAEYLILHQLSYGGMGASYEVGRTSDGSHWVLKKLDKTADSATVAEFWQEVNLLRSLNHESVPRVADEFQFDHSQYLVMERIEGRTLEDLLEAHGGPLPEKDVVNWGAQLCYVLDYLHTRTPPIIYRNLKPSTIMVDNADHIKLTDFSIARRFKWNKKHDTQPLGTKGYAAPEQYGKAQSDARTDLYALGATLHHLLTNDDPSNRKVGEFPSLDTYPQVKISRRTRQTIAAALEIQREKRPQTAADFYEMLTGKKFPTKIG